MFDPFSFKLMKPLVLPVMLVLDVPARAFGARLDNLNGAIGNMVRQLKDKETPSIEVQFSILRYGDSKAKLERFTPISQYAFSDLSPGDNNGGDVVWALGQAGKAISEFERTHDNVVAPAVALVGMRPSPRVVKTPFSGIPADQCDRYALTVCVETESCRDAYTSFLDGTGRELYTAWDGAYKKSGGVSSLNGNGINWFISRIADRISARIRAGGLVDAMPGGPASSRTSGGVPEELYI